MGGLRTGRLMGGWVYEWMCGWKEGSVGPRGEASVSALTSPVIGSQGRGV